METIKEILDSDVAVCDRVTNAKRGFNTGVMLHRYQEHFDPEKVKVRIESLDIAIDFLERDIKAAIKSDRYSHFGGMEKNCGSLKALNKIKKLLGVEQ